MVLPEERDLIVEKSRKNVFQKYKDIYIISKTPCPFLKKNGLCEIENIKPIDCKAFPVCFKLLKDNKIEWRIITECPAVKLLNKNFINNAKKLYLTIPLKFRKYEFEIIKISDFKTKKI